MEDGPHRAQGAMGQGGKSSQIQDAANNAADGACVRMGCSTVADLLRTNTVFLSGEREGDKCARE